MSDAEKYFRDRANKLRRFMGLCPLTQEEAAEALRKMPKWRASEAEIAQIVQAVTRAEFPDADQEPQGDWTPEYDHGAIERDAVLFRNEGESDPASQMQEEELLEELLKDDEPDDKNKLED